MATERDQIQAEKAKLVRANLEHNAQEHAVDTSRTAHEAHVAHENHRLQERSVQARIQRVDASGDYNPNPKINPYASARNGSILGRGDWSTQDQKDDPDAAKGRYLPLARHKPMLAGGDYV